MEMVCYRCSATVEPDAQYCHNCGTPQIRFVAQDEPAAAAEESNPPGTISQTDRVDSISWPVAIRIAVVVAIVVGILSTLVAAGSILWVAAGSVVAMNLYRRRRPRAFLPRRAGARIGGLVGLLTAFVALAGNGMFLLIQRYGMHQGHQIDSQLTTIVTQAAARATAMDPQAPVAVFTSFWLSPEGRIGLILLTMAFLSALIVLFAIAGGIFGAQMYRSPRTGKLAS